MKFMTLIKPQFLAVAMVMAMPPSATPTAILSCQNAVLPMEDGTQYLGLVQSERYRFSAQVPHDRVGWGVQAPAPFHGFIVFLDGEGRYREGDSCIDLYVGTQVDLSGDETATSKDRRPERAVMIGGKKGSEIIERETTATGRSFVIASVRLNLPLASGESDQISVMLITPSEKYRTNRRIFDRFLAGMRFW